MSDIYKLQYSGMTLAYPGWNGYVCYEKPSGYPITYLSDEHVSVTGDDLYLPGSEGLQLQSSYDPYYRIDYEITNGEIVDGLLVPSGPCTVYAKDKINYFTATGGWEKGSNVNAVARHGTYEGDAKVPAKYAIHEGHTGDIPTSWYSNSNRWNVNSDVSSYSITMNPIMGITAQKTYASATMNSRYTAYSYIGSTATAGEAKDNLPVGITKYNKTFTTDITGVNYSISAHLHTWAGGNTNRNYTTAGYVASYTTGTWTATGIAP